LKNSNKTMKASEYRKALDTLGLTVVGASALGLGRRQCQRIAAGDCKVPDVMATLLRMMIKHKIKPETLTK
jgi:hypothetical protein